MSILYNHTLIIQARLGSSRLPGKVLMDFHNGNSILDILIKNALSFYDKKNIVIATSVSKENSALLCLKRKYDVDIYFGSENDVLDRFANIAMTKDSEKIARICADNPFIDFKLNLELLEKEDDDFDYLSYSINNTPAILTHYGFFYEFISKKALLHTYREAKEAKYREHVTNYIYSNNDLFNICFIQAPKDILDIHNIRLTIDDKIDFELLSKVYTYLFNGSYNIEYNYVIHFLENNKKLLHQMKAQIEKYSKS